MDDAMIGKDWVDWCVVINAFGWSFVEPERT